MTFCVHFKFTQNNTDSEVVNVQCGYRTLDSTSVSVWALLGKLYLPNKETVLNNQLKTYLVTHLELLSIL